MKKFFSAFHGRFAVALIAALLLSQGNAFAAATKSRTASQDKANYTVGVTDLSTGNTADVTNAGDLVIRPRAKTEVRVTSSGKAIIGAATVYSITCTSGQAGDQFNFYDSDNSLFDNLPAFEIEVGTAKS